MFYHAIPKSPKMYCTEFICDTLTNSCKANQAAKDLCANATHAAAAAAAKTGVQADVFNAAFGIITVRDSSCIFFNCLLNHIGY
jgi:hypothetical protein